MPNIIDLRKQKKNAASAGKQKTALKPAQKNIFAPRIQMASMSAAFPSQKPPALFPEAKKANSLALPKTEEIKPGTEERLIAPLFEWSANERAFSDEERKGKNIVIIGGAALIAIPALFIGNYLLAIFIALAAFVLYASGNKKTTTIQCAVTTRGVQIENRVYEFADLKSFWIFYDPDDTQELSLESKKTIMPHIRAPLGGVNPVKLRATLLKFIPEKKHEESLTDIIGRKFFE